MKEGKWRQPSRIWFKHGMDWGEKNDRTKKMMNDKNDEVEVTESKEAHFLPLDSCLSLKWAD